MDIIPVKQEYIFTIAGHTMRAVVDHLSDKRYMSYYFDKKMVASKVLEGGEYYTDDECIYEVVEDYRKNNKNVYSDIFNHHMDKISLSKKIVEVDIVNYGIVLKSKVEIVKNYYEIELYTDGGENTFHGKFKAEGFSEVLEKMRLFTITMEGVSTELTDKINLLSNDKIEKSIKWEE